MSRALRHAVGVLLAVAVVVSARSAPAAATQDGSPRQGENALYDGNVILSNAQTRLEVMKVELALLSDPTTFPYYFEGRFVSGTLELHGYVPHDLVRHRAVELARRSTFLKVTDALEYRAELSVRPPQRPARVLQQEVAELLQKSLGEPAKWLSVGVRTNGVIVLTGPIDSVENKLEMSRLLRRLPGCCGVANKLTVQRVARDGQHVVLVTRDGSMVVSSSAWELESQQSAVPALTAPLPKPGTASPTPAAPAPATILPTAIPPVPVPSILPPAQLSANELPAPATRLPGVIPPPPPISLTATPLPAKSLEAQKDELRLPTAVPPKSAPERIGCVPYTPAEPKLPVKWTASTIKWEDQAEKLESLNGSSAPSPPPAADQHAESSTQASPAGLQTEAKQTRVGAAELKPSEASKTSRSRVEEKPAVASPVMTWRPPGASEESEIKAPTPPFRKDASLSAPARTKLASLTPSTPLSSPRRWPPAYEPSPPPGQGRPGLIVFDDDTPPPPKPQQITTATVPVIAPASLQRRVKSVCGWQAQAVTVETQHGGILLVRVKVPNLSVQDQLSRKILAIPEMTAPKVRLLMDVGP